MTTEFKAACGHMTTATKLGHICPECFINTHAELADLRERHEAFVREVKGVLRDIAQPRDCGCVPCRGQCISQPALLIEADEMRDLATTAIALCDDELKGETQ